jgi:hypothetical protein
VGLPEAQNGAMTESPAGSVCPQCGSAAAVHSVQELGDMARMRLEQLQQGYQGEPGYPGASQQAGQPGWEATPRPIHEQGSGGGGFYGGPRTFDSYDTSFGDDVAGLALDAAAKFIGRAIGRRVQRAAERAVPVIAANQETTLRNQIAIAERHPDLRACLTDKVIFLAGGSRVLPMGNLMTITPEQADAMVASLRE